MISISTGAKARLFISQTLGRVDKGIVIIFMFLIQIGEKNRVGRSAKKTYKYKISYG